MPRTSHLRLLQFISTVPLFRSQTAQVFSKKTDCMCRSQPTVGAAVILGRSSPDRRDSSSPDTQPRLFASLHDTPRSTWHFPEEMVAICFLTCSRQAVTLDAMTWVANIAR